MLTPVRCCSGGLAFAVVVAVAVVAIVAAVAIVAVSSAPQRCACQSWPCN